MYLLSASCRSALEIECDSEPWDLVVNCAGETKNAQSDAVYKEGIFTLSMNCVKECARLKVKRYIEITSGCMFSSEKVAVNYCGFYTYNFYFVKRITQLPVVFIECTFLSMVFITMYKVLHD